MEFRDGASLRNYLGKQGFQLKGFVGREFNYVAKQLLPNETPLAAVDGLMSGDSWLCVLTDRQFWFIDHGMVYGVKVERIPLSKVNAVSAKEGLVFADLAITNGANVTVVRNVTKDLARRFVQVANQELAALDQGSGRTVGNESQKASPSPADELLKYKQLLDAGAISAQDYQQIKQKLLGQSLGIQNGGQSHDGGPQVQPNESKQNPHGSDPDLSRGGSGIGV